MARSRVIKPEFWSDEKLARVSRESRLTFAGLWTTSDDYGVTKGSAAWIKSQVYPYDEDISSADVQRWLDDLERHGFIKHFYVNGEKFYHIKHFSEHQRVDKPSRTRNPEPPADLYSLESIETIATDSRETRDGLATDSRDSSDETEVETELETEKIVCGKEIEGGVGGERGNQPTPTPPCQPVAQEHQPPPHTPKKTQADKRKTKLPQDFCLAETLVAYAKQHGINGDSVREVFDHFCDHHRAKGSLMLDWTAAWRTWVRNEARFRARYQRREPEQLSYIELRRRMGAPEYADE